MGAVAHDQPKSMDTLMSPATCTCALSMGLNPARSSISLAASSCTCSDLAPVARLITLAAAAVAFNPSCSVTRCIIYCCTCGKRIVRDALTLPDSPSAYPASLAASRNVQPVATRVSTKAVCFGVNLRCSMLICVSPLAPLSLSPPTLSIVNEGDVNAQYGRSECYSNCIIVAGDLAPAYSAGLHPIRDWASTRYSAKLLIPYREVPRHCNTTAR